MNYKETYKNVIDELMSFQQAKKLVEYYKRKMGEIEASIGAQNFAPDGIRVYQELYPAEKFIEKMEKWKKKYEEAYVYYTCRENDILNKINKLKYPYCEVLRLRYIELAKYEMMAVTLSYDYRHIIRLHERALKIYGEINNIKIKDIKHVI